MSEMIEIVVDSTSYIVKEGSLLIDLLIKEKIKVPYFCYHESLGTDGNCRMCMVEIEGQKRPQIACDTLVKRDMKINSKSKMIKEVRRNILELELINHPVDCPICDQAGECSLQDFYMEYGLNESKVTISDKVKNLKHIDLGSNVILDQERCVLCARCTRFTDKITHTHELGIIGRGDNARVSTMPNKKLYNPYAMNVVDLCPVGALTSKDFRFSQRVWFLQTVNSICHGCAKGCNIYIDHNKIKYQDDFIYRFRPRRNDDINGFFICDYGRLSYKKLQENRQEETLLYNHIVTEDKAIIEAKNLINIYKNQTIIIIDANLFNEEIDAIITFSKSINAEVYSPLDIYIDKLFQDNMLKSSNRAANSIKIQNSNINTKNPPTTSLIINFNHPQKFQAKKEINFITHKRENTSITLPISVYSENSGTLINEDGIEQICEKAIFKNNPIPTIIEYIDKISS